MSLGYFYSRSNNSTLTDMSYCDGFEELRCWSVVAPTHDHCVALLYYRIFYSIVPYLFITNMTLMNCRRLWKKDDVFSYFDTMFRGTVTCTWTNGCSTNKRMNEIWKCLHWTPALVQNECVTGKTKNVILLRRF